MISGIILSLIGDFKAKIISVLSFWFSTLNAKFSGIPLILVKILALRLFLPSFELIYKLKSFSSIPLNSELLGFMVVFILKPLLSE